MVSTFALGLDEEASGWGIYNRAKLSTHSGQEAEKAEKGSDQIPMWGTIPVT